MQIILTAVFFLIAALYLVSKHHRSGFGDGLENEIDDQKRSLSFVWAGAKVIFVIAGLVLAIALALGIGQAVSSHLS